MSSAKAASSGNKAASSGNKSAHVEIAYPPPVPGKKILSEIDWSIVNRLPSPQLALVLPDQNAFSSESRKKAAASEDEPWIGKDAKSLLHLVDLQPQTPNLNPNELEKLTVICKSLFADFFKSSLDQGEDDLKDIEENEYSEKLTEYIKKLTKDTEKLTKDTEKLTEKLTKNKLTEHERTAIIDERTELINKRTESINKRTAAINKRLNARIYRITERIYRLTEFAILCYSPCKEKIPELTYKEFAIAFLTYYLTIRTHREPVQYLFKYRVKYANVTQCAILLTSFLHDSSSASGNPAIPFFKELQKIPGGKQKKTKSNRKYNRNTRRMSVI